MTAATTDNVLTTSVSLLGGLFDEVTLVELVSRCPREVQERFTTYVAEALFFRSFFRADLERLEPGSHVVEIGSGIGLLARLIAADGFAVTAFEPQAAGFGQMHQLSEMLQRCWRGEQCHVTFVNERFEPAAGDDQRASLIIGVHVIEHVREPLDLIVGATRSLTATGAARFICPNYAFPYEPHFDVPTFFNKRLTGRLLRAVIDRSSIEDARRFWDDLSWPTTHALRRSLHAVGVEHQFSRAALIAYMSRLDEAAFVQRKHSVFRVARVVKPLFETAARHAPIAIIPIIDLTTRLAASFEACTEGSRL